MNIEKCDQHVVEAVKRAISDAKIYLLMKCPFVGAVSTRIDFVLTYKIPTAATDGRTIYYNPNFFKDLNKGEIVFVIGHEILHIVYDHVFRRGNKNTLIWNMAIDYIVNYTLVKNKIGIIPENALFDEKYSDEYTSEELYEILLRDNVKIVSNMLDVHLDGPEDTGDEKGEGNINVEKLGSGINKEEIENIRKEIKSIIFGLRSSMVDATNIPKGIARVIDKLSTPVIDWKNVLFNFIKSSIKVDYDFRKPNSMSWVYNVVMPNFSTGEKISAHVFIDSSGSITDEQLADFLGEIKNMAETFDDFYISVSSFDTKVYNTQEYDPNNISEISKYKAMGGGGTDFDCIFNYLKEKNIVPNSLIIFTDGRPYDSWGDPNYCGNETIFLINNKYENIKAPFGTTIKYEKN